jgi:hypothetical protein
MMPTIIDGSLQDLRLDEVADARLGPDRDGDRVHDAHDHRWVAHARDTAGGADVRGHALERHHGDGTRVLGDLCLLGRDDIHDHAALEHLGQTLLGHPGRCFNRHRVGWTSGFRGRRAWIGLAAGSSPVRARYSSRRTVRDYRTRPMVARVDTGPVK